MPQATPAPHPTPPPAGGSSGGPKLRKGDHVNGPVSGTISSPFGMRNHPIQGRAKPHEGIDIAAAKGTPVHSSGSGTVTKAAWQNPKDQKQGYGKEVVVLDGKDNETRYGHLDSWSVTTGQAVRRGDEIGKVGSTGASTGNHLHYEERHNGVAHEPTFDPDHYQPPR